MSHLHKSRLAQINDEVEDLKKERTPAETASALADAATITGELAMARSSPELVNATLATVSKKKRAKRK